MSGRVIVCGGRTFTNSLLVSITLDHLLECGEVSCLVQGGAMGADAIAKQWALSRDLAVQTFYADWNRHGKKAGPIRNQEMIDAGADLVVAFTGGRGTADLVSRARKAKIEVMIIHDDARAL